MKIEIVVDPSKPQQTLAARVAPAPGAAQNAVARFVLVEAFGWPSLNHCVGHLQQVQEDVNVVVPVRPGRRKLKGHPSQLLTSTPRWRYVMRAATSPSLTLAQDYTSNTAAPAS